MDSTLALHHKLTVSNARDVGPGSTVYLWVLFLARVATCLKRTGTVVANSHISFPYMKRSSSPAHSAPGRTRLLLRHAVYAAASEHDLPRAFHHHHLHRFVRQMR
jgi:hypothetical protein